MPVDGRVTVEPVDGRGVVTVDGLVVFLSCLFTVVAVDLVELEEVEGLDTEVDGLVDVDLVVEDEAEVDLELVFEDRDVVDDGAGLDAVEPELPLLVCAKASD